MSTPPSPVSLASSFGSASASAALSHETPTRVVSRAELSVEKSKTTQKSVFRRVYAEAPLALTTPKNHGHAAWAFPTVLGPGMIDGDEHAFTVEVDRDASLYVGSVGIARAFTGTTTLRLEAKVAPGALLVYAPEPLTGATGALLTQHQRFSLAEGASLIAVDAICEGRPATGEKWRFSRLRSRLSVIDRDELRLEEAQDLDPRSHDVAAHFSEYGAFGFAVAIGPRAKAFRHAWLAREPSGRGDLLLVSAKLGDDGATVRLAAKSAAKLSEEVTKLLGNLDETLGDDPRSRRSW